ASKELDQHMRRVLPSSNYFLKLCERLSLMLEHHKVDPVPASVSGSVEDVYLVYKLTEPPPYPKAKHSNWFRDSRLCWRGHSCTTCREIYPFIVHREHNRRTFVLEHPRMTQGFFIQREYEHIKNLLPPALFQVDH